nr:mandelate racemase/muconate lactonizing enzyme family protein [Bradyrhizobium macuxiense]
MGYLFVFRPGMKSIAACLDECIIPRVKGKDATAIEAIWRDLWTATMTYGRGGIAAMAMSALDIALWDAVGKRAGLPLHRLWGHYRSQIPVYGSGCFRGAGGDGMIEKALHFVKQGYKAIKMQVAHVHTPAQDLDNVRRMREALGPDIDIMIDVNMGWSADVAIEMGRKFEKYDIYWLEEPVPADDFAGYQRIAAALDMRVVGGETDPLHALRSEAVLSQSLPADPAARPDARRHDGPAQDRSACGHFRRHHRAASVSRTQCAPARLDSQRDLVREHGADRRPLGRSAADCQWHDHGAGAARTRAQIQGRRAEVQNLKHDPEKCEAVFRRDKRGTRLRGDHAQTKS